jgi:hypothetical protein
MGGVEGGGVDQPSGQAEHRPHASLDLDRDRWDRHRDRLIRGAFELEQGVRQPDDRGRIAPPEDKSEQRGDRSGKQARCRVRVAALRPRALAARGLEQLEQHRLQGSEPLRRLGAQRLWLQPAEQRRDPE